MTLWRDPDFLKLWTGQTISQIGSRISREGIPLTAVLVLGATPLQMGYLGGAAGIAVLLFGLFAGAWADRLRRRPILILTDLTRAAILVTIPLAAAFHHLTMAQLYVAAALTGICTVFFDVSYQSHLSDLVDPARILEGNSKLALTESIAEVAGPGLTGILVQLITAPLAILFDAVSFVVSAISLSLIGRPEPPPHPSPEPDILNEIAAGLSTCWHTPILRALALRTGTAAFFMGFISSLYMLFALRELHLTPAMLGLIISIGGASSIAGTFLVKRLGMIQAALIAGLSALLIPFAQGPILLATSQLLDMAWPVYNINELTLRQSITPSHLLGRVNSAIHLLFQGILPAGALAGGAVAQQIGIRQTLFLGAAGYLLSTLWLIFSPVRRAAIN